MVIIVFHQEDISSLLKSLNETIVINLYKIGEK